MRQVLIAVVAASLAAGGFSTAEEQKLPFGRLGTVTVYRQSPHPKHVVLFVSGDGGWNLGVVDMARELATLDSMVAGIDITGYLKALAAARESCVYPAADLEALSQYLQKKFEFPDYVTPVLVGYSSGATLVYAVLAQAPPGTFAGAVSLGFCPDLELSKPLCRGHGLEFDRGPKGKGVVFRPVLNLEQPFVALQGTIDQVCHPPATESYVARVPHGEVVVLPKVGHGFAVPRNWMPQFRNAFQRVVASPPAAPTAQAAPGEGAGAPTPGSVDDLPLVELPASGSGGPPDLFAVIVSGDGGWASLDREIGKALSARGVPVVGLDSLRYFWNARTPDGAAADLARILESYAAKWQRARVVLVGYSRGADVLPFMTARLPEALRSRVALLALLGIEPSVAFEFHVADWLGGAARDELPVAPEVGKLKGLTMLCFQGEGERDSLCPQLAPGLTEVVRLPGGHHFDGAYADIARRILAAVP